MKRILCISLILALIFSSSTVLAEIVEKHWSRDSVSEGEIIEVPFPHKVENIDVPSGMEYLGYDNGIHSFIALEDLENVEGYLYFEKIKGEEDIDLDSGESNDVGDPGEGAGTQVDWNGFELGKHGWNHEIGRQYAIRLDVQDYQEYDYIYLQDISEGLSEPLELDVRIVVPDENGLANTIDSLDYEFVENEEGKFTIKMKVLELSENEEMRYDVFYKMRKTNNTFSNGYRVYTKSEWEEFNSGGNVDGTIVEQPPAVEEDKPNIEEDEEPIVEDDEPIVEEDNESYIPEDITPGNPIIDEPIIEEDDESITEDTEDIELEEEEEEEVIIEDDEEIVENTEDEEIVELLPKTGIAEVFNIVIALGFILILFGLKNLTNK